MTKATSKVALYSSTNRNTINKIYDQIRQKIFLAHIRQKEKCQGKLFGEFKLKESYFGAKRIRAKRGRGVVSKTLVFTHKLLFFWMIAIASLLWTFKRDGKVYVGIVKNFTREQLMPIIQGKILECSTININSWKIYDGLILNGYTHHRVFHSDNEFARGKIMLTLSNLSGFFVKED